MKRLLGIWVFVFLSGCGGCGGGGGGGSSGPVLVESTLRRFGSDLRQRAPIVPELEKALTARMTNEDFTVIARQYLHLTEAVARHQPLPRDEAFVAVVKKLSDLPYFREFDQAIGGAGGVAAPPPVTVRARLGQARAALSAPTCSPNCGLSAASEIYLVQGLSTLAGLAEGFDVVSNGTACTTGVSQLYACVAANSCDRAVLSDFTLSCSQALGSLAVLASAGAASPWLVGTLAVVGGAAGIYSTVTQADAAVAKCEQFQAQNCCQAQVPCGATCCPKGDHCQGGQCVHPNVAGCLPGDTACGAYCCGPGLQCQGGACLPPPTCVAPSTACGASCCDAGQLCVWGSCTACPQALCGGVACCGAGRFCNAVGQCLEEPEGGCALTCGTGCCRPGQTCSAGACEGAALTCGDGVCTEGVETPLVCPADCPSGCGDGICQPWETTYSCGADCLAACGNGFCESGEPASCPPDCLFCGDGVCGSGEVCPADCPNAGPDAGSPGCGCVSAATPTCCGNGTCCAPSQVCCPTGCCDSGGACPPQAPSDCATCCPNDSCCVGDLYCCGDCDTGC